MEPNELLFLLISFRTIRSNRVIDSLSAATRLPRSVLQQAGPIQSYGLNGVANEVTTLVPLSHTHGHHMRLL